MKRAKQVCDLADAALTCRDEGHLWSFVTDRITQVGDWASEFTQVRRCTRCQTVRERTISTRDFSVTKTNYRYPDGYLFERGAQVTRQRMRHEVLDRVLARRSREEVS